MTMQLNNSTIQALMMKRKRGTKSVPGTFGSPKLKKISQFPTHAQTRRVVRNLRDTGNLPKFLEDKKVGWILNNYKNSNVREFILKHFPNAFV